MSRKNDEEVQDPGWFQALRNLFRDPGEKRVKSLWRIILFIVVLFFALIVMTFAINLVIALIFSNTATDLNSSGLLFVISILQMFIMPLAVMMTLWVMARYIDKRKITRYGLMLNKSWWADLFVGALISVAMVVVIFGVQVGLGWTHIVSTRQNNLVPLSFEAGMILQILFFVPIIFFEEIGIRGYIIKNICEGLNQKALKPWAGPVIGLVLSSIAIAVSNAGNFSSNWLHLIFFVGSLLAFGYGYILTGQLGLTIGFHLGWVIFQGAVFGFTINGEKISNAMIVTYTNGPEFLTGGNFGPMGGFLGFVFSLLGAALVYFYIHWSRQGAREYCLLSSYEPEEQLGDRTEAQQSE